MKNFIKGRWFPLTFAILIVAAVAFVMALFGWRITYAPELENSWDAISGCAAWAGVFASFVAIWCAIRIPLKIAEMQDDLQKRQIKIDTYPYRLACYEALYTLKGFTESTKKILEVTDIKKKTPSETQKIISYINENKNISSNEIMLKLKEGEFVFQVSEWKKLKEIRKCYNRICFDFSIIESFYKDYLSAEHKESIRKEKTDEILKDLKHLDELLYYIIPAVEPDLVLSDLHLYPGIYIKQQ